MDDVKIFLCGRNKNINTADYDKLKTGNLRLLEENKKLKEANEKLKETIEHIRILKGR